MEPVQLIRAAVRKLFHLTQHNSEHRVRSKEVQGGRISLASSHPEAFNPAVNPALIMHPNINHGGTWF
jgi:hypothetical protein